MIWGDWKDDSFLVWTKRVANEYYNTRFEIISVSQMCATIVRPDSVYYRILCYGCSRRLALILEALDSIFEIVPIKTIMRTKAIRVRARNKLELLYHALLINVSGTLDNCMLFINSFYKFGLNPVEIQFFQNNNSKFYKKLKSKNEVLFEFFSNLKNKHSEDLQSLRNTTCHRIVPYYPEVINDTEGYNDLISDWNSSIRNGKANKPLDDNPFELNGGWVRFEDIESDGYFFASLHDSCIRYCSLMLDVVRKAITVMATEASIEEYEG